MITTLHSRHSQTDRPNSQTLRLVIPTWLTMLLLTVINWIRLWVQEGNFIRPHNNSRRTSSRKQYAMGVRHTRNKYGTRAGSMGLTKCTCHRRTPTIIKTSHSIGTNPIGSAATMKNSLQLKKSRIKSHLNHRTWTLKLLVFTPQNHLVASVSTRTSCESKPVCTRRKRWWHRAEVTLRTGVWTGANRRVQNVGLLDHPPIQIKHSPSRLALPSTWRPRRWGDKSCMIRSFHRPSPVVPIFFHQMMVQWSCHYRNQPSATSRALKELMRIQMSILRLRLKS